MNAAVDLKNVCLETDRLILREWKECDLNDFFEYASVDRWPAGNPISLLKNLQLY